MGRKSKKRQMKDADGLTKSERKEIQALCSQLLDLCKTPTQVSTQKQWEEYKQIRGVVEMIRTKQQGLHKLFLDENRDDNLENLLTWVKDNGAMCNNIQIANYDTEGYGIQATTEIKVHINNTYK
ncbi:actin-histidine N-methyltransferase-like [Anneissia japonica]|uniref:actin-histidine N-methyltransferase-like n=1 Tax=Anneissia japonica TaxID=1529436 RepID=UPI001425673C|nr:actin-histidine N-methyltransferase-like [Anneissia japonica]